MNVRHRVAALPLMLISLFVFSQAAMADMSNKWRMEFNGSANSDGAITVRISPEGGIPLEITTLVSKGTRENMVAKAVVESLQSKLPRGAYNVERDDGEDVLIKKGTGTPNFGLDVLSNTVKNVKINLDKE